MALENASNCHLRLQLRLWFQVVGVDRVAVVVVAVVEVVEADVVVVADHFGGQSV